MDNKSFLKILRRYKSGEATELEKLLVEQWYDLLNDENTTISDMELEAAEQHVWAQINHQIHHERPKRTLLRSLSHYRKQWVAAAAVLLISLFVWLAYDKMGARWGNDHTLTGRSNEQYLIIKNEQNVVKEIQLPDDTKISLEPGAIIKTPKKIQSNKREVYLEGEAFFNVAKNPSQPFYVYAGPVTTHVLGTSFRIKPLNQKGVIEVSVRSGRVEVFESTDVAYVSQSGKQKGLVLTPNQRVVYHQDGRYFETSLVSQPLPLLKEDQEEVEEIRYQFSDVSILEIVSNLEKTYGVDIELENASAFKDCTFTGDIQNQNLYEKLEILCVALGVKFEVRGTRIIIKGNGCS